MPRRIAAFVLAAAGAALVLAFAVLFMPVVVQEQNGDARVFLQSQRQPDNTACAWVEWKVDGIRTVSLNGRGRVGEGQEMVCGDAVLRVEFQDGSAREYRADLSRSAPLRTFTLLAQALALLGMLLWSERSRAQPASPLRYRLGAAGLALGLLLAALWAGQSSGLDAFIASIPVFSGGATSAGQWFLLAIAAALVYWLFMPGSRRALVLVSGLAFVLLGATFELVGLVALLTLLVWTVVSERPPLMPDAKFPRLLSGLSLLYIAALLLALALVASAHPPAFLSLTLFAVMLALVWAGILFARRWLPPQSQPAESQPATPWTARLVGTALAFALLAVVALSLLRMPAAWAVPALVMDKLVVAHLLLFSVVPLRLIGGHLSSAARRRIAYAIMVAIVVAFVLLKSAAGPVVGLVEWLGFSYIAFRLLHILLEYVNGRDLCGATGAETLLYVLFFPALPAGPIDRLPRFVEDSRGEAKQFNWRLAYTGLARMVVGGAKKFFIADVLLAPLAMSGTLSPYTSTAFTWLRLYAIAFYLYLDFAGFIDMAIGAGMLFGYTLPENFDAPYRKINLAQFWQSWHMTLSNWLRTYIFLPLSRTLLRSRLRSHPRLIVLITQMTTMLLIGLWHGITLNFALWGLWHGGGLFVHKVFADETRRWQRQIKQSPPVARLMDWAGVVLTFHFVALGWILFVMPTPEDSLRFALRLLGRGA
jgi:D-alanyl-lipoteichoic acid acyltransferase DltB (MBOAT superfamily)